MKELYEIFGFEVKKHRKIKNYSTQELARILGVSVGLINNIENAKNDVFKLDMLVKLMSELDISIEDLTGDKTSRLNSVYVKPVEESITFNIKSKGLSEQIDSIEKYIKLIICSYLSAIAEFNYTGDAAKFISNHIIQELEYLTELKSLQSK